MNKFILNNSGKSVEISLATVEQALTLFRIVAHECKHAGLDLHIDDDTTVASLLEKNTEALLNIISSEVVLEAIKDCCSKVLYNKQRFDMNLFEDEKNRGDFFPLMELVAIENLRPFFPQYHTVFDVITYPLLKK